jgi:hypothetical protein
MDGAFVSLWTRPRIGQTESVLIQHLMLEGSFEGRMAAAVIHKMDVIERAVG